MNPRDADHRDVNISAWRHNNNDCVMITVAKTAYKCVSPIDGAT